MTSPPSLPPLSQTHYTFTLDQQIIWLLTDTATHAQKFAPILQEIGYSQHPLPVESDLKRQGIDHPPNLIIFPLKKLTAHWEHTLQFLQSRSPATKILFTLGLSDPTNELKARKLENVTFFRGRLTPKRLKKQLVSLISEPADDDTRGADIPSELQITGVPIRTKITMPYVMLAIFVAVAMSLAVGRLVFENIEERFTNQLIEAGKLTADLMVREEGRRLETLRLIANTEGIQDSVRGGDAERLREILLPIAVNTQEEAVEILDPFGVSLLSLRHREGGTVEDYLSSKDEDVYAQWSFIQSIMAQQADDNLDKYAGIIQASWGDFFYVAGPINDADGELVGIILVGKSLPTLVRQMRQDTFAQITAYSVDGLPIASTLPIEQPFPLTPAERAIASHAPDETTILRDQTTGSIDYSELLAIWQVRGDTDIALFGVALPNTFFIQASQTTQLQLFLLALISLSAVISAGILVSNRITSPLLEIVKASTAVAQGDLNVSVSPDGKDEIAQLGRSFNHMLGSLREGELYRDLLGQAVTPQVRDELRRSLASGSLRLDGQLQTASILFSDIRSFTTLSEEHGPTVMFKLLNDYFAEMIPAVTDEGGVVTEFAGDAILALFGLLPRPLSPDESAYQACLAAVNMLTIINNLNDKRAALNQPQFVTGIGVNTGTVSAGSVGSNDRLHYTVIGDAVNITSRLQDYTKNFGETGIVISQETYEALGSRRERFLLEPLGSHLFKGKTETLHIYRLRPRSV